MIHLHSHTGVLRDKSIHESHGQNDIFASFAIHMDINVTFLHDHIIDIFIIMVVGSCGL